jgi:ribosome-binding protein aMBF1 (putative translation factor)
MECFKCGISGDKVKLLDVISERGIVKICEKCFLEENLPLVRKPTNFQLKKLEILPKSPVKKTVYERLSEMAGVRNEGIRKNESLDKQETTLKEIMNQNFETVSGKEQKEDLADNFHWVIMRARRLRHLTQGQFAKAIAEPEAAIKAIEKGFLPKNNYRLIKKIENYLGIKIMKKDAVEQKGEFEKKISFDPVTAKTLTISDLQDMKKKKEEEIMLNPKEGADFSGVNKKELSKEEIDDMIFGGN